MPTSSWGYPVILPPEDIWHLVLSTKTLALQFFSRSQSPGMETTECVRL